GYAAAKRITIPTLIIHGDKDEAVPIAQSQKTASLLAHGKLHIIAGADHHFRPKDHFDEVIKTTTTFLTHDQ
ncbi:MAG: prolyl oligopeptidase family serine peptidase, partial [Nanoarchaeota archaeon]